MEIKLSLEILSPNFRQMRRLIVFSTIMLSLFLVACREDSKTQQDSAKLQAGTMLESPENAKILSDLKKRCEALNEDHQTEYQLVVGKVMKASWIPMPGDLPPPGYHEDRLFHAEIKLRQAEHQGVIGNIYYANTKFEHYKENKSPYMEIGKTYAFCASYYKRNDLMEMKLGGPKGLPDIFRIDDVDSIQKLEE